MSAKPTAERLVVDELFIELGVVLEHGGHHALQRLVMLDLGVLFVGVFLVFWYAVSAATWAGISSVMSLRTWSLSVQGTSPN